MNGRFHSWLLPLTSLTRDHLPLVGAKNLSLGVLGRLGLATPPGFALSTAAFEAHLKDAGVSLDRAPEAAATELRRSILETPLGAEAREAIREATEHLRAGGSTVAARSSLYPFEDDPRHSCAGLFVSRLNLTSTEATEAAVRECFASLFQDSTLAYLRHHDLDLRLARMSVGLQATVEAAASATVFSQDPITRNERLLYIDAAHGFGGVTNSALVETDSFFLEKGDPPRIISRRKGTKRRRLMRGAQGGLELLPNTSMGFAIEDEALLRIGRDVARIEEALGGPQDVELALTISGEILYLQTRGTPPAPRSITEIHVATGDQAPLVDGSSVVFGAATAPLRLHHDTSRNADAIILKADLSVRDVPKMYGARGLLVRNVPPTSHPAIHLREIGVPTLSVGDRFPELEPFVGREVTLDTSGERGAVFLGALAIHREELSGQQLPATPARIHLLTTYPSPLWSAFVRDSAVEGIHVRGESVNNDDIRTHPLALLAYDEDTIEGGDRYLIERRIAGYTDGASYYIAKFVERLGLLRATLRPDQLISLRFTDLLTSDYRRLIGGAPFEGPEENPVLGLRGAARLLHPRFRALLDLELKAMRQVISLHPGRYQLLIPVVRAPEEVTQIREIMRGMEIDIPLGIMVETPAAVLLAGRLASLADFFCIGAADLTQLLYGADRTHDELRAHTSPGNEATLVAVRLVLEALRGQGKDVYLTELLYLVLVPDRALVSNNRLKVVTWPDRLLRTARTLHQVADGVSNRN